MHKSGWIISMLVCLCGGSLFGQCPNGITTIFFANGIWTTADQSYTSTYKKLKPAVLSRLNDTGSGVNQSCLVFTPAYDSQFVDTGNQKINNFEIGSQIIAAIQQRGLDLPTWLWGSNTSDWLVQILQTAESAAVSVNSSDLLTQEGWYSSAGSGANTAIVVAHSQGNLYVNEVYPLVSLVASIKPISVASPATHTSTGPWFTLANDIILAVAPGSLRADISNNPSCGSALNEELECHDFDKSYMSGNNGQPGENAAGNNTGPAIADAVIAAIPGSHPGGWFFNQTNASATSSASWYGDNWYDLGTGFFGSLQSLTVKCYTSGGNFPSSSDSLSLQEFADSGYTNQTNTFPLSGVAGNPTCGPSLSDVSFTNLNIKLASNRFYRLITNDTLQNASVRLLGTSSLGRAMYDAFDYGVGRVENYYEFYPYLSTTVSPPPKCPPVADPQTINGLAYFPIRQIYSSGITINSIGLWTAPVGGGYCCSQSYLTISLDGGNSSTVPTSSVVTLPQGGSAGEQFYQFSPPVSIPANTAFWISLNGGPSVTTNGTYAYGATGFPFLDYQASCPAQ